MIPAKTGYRLQQLDCSTCGAPLAAGGDDVVYYCTACRNGYQLAEDELGLSRVEVSFVAVPDRSVDLWRPFWILPAQVTLQKRSASGGQGLGLLRLFLGDQRPEGQGPGDGTFAIPAFAGPLTSITRLAQRYTTALPELGEILGERLTGGLYRAKDAQALAHFTLIATEAEKPDLLKDLQYTIEFGQPRLLGVPFVRQRGSRQAEEDALFGLPI